MMNAIYDVLGVPFGIILKLIFDAVRFTLSLLYSMGLCPDYKGHFH